MSLLLHSATPWWRTGKITCPHDQTNYLRDMLNYPHDETHYLHEMLNYPHDETHYLHEMLNYPDYELHDLGEVLNLILPDSSHPFGTDSRHLRW